MPQYKHPIRLDTAKNELKAKIDGLIAANTTTVKDLQALVKILNAGLTSIEGKLPKD